MINREYENKKYKQTESGIYIPNKEIIIPYKEKQIELLDNVDKKALEKIIKLIKVN